MLDILIPAPVANLSLLNEAVDRLEQFTDTPFSLTVIVDGGTRDMLTSAERRLEAFGGEWKLLHNSQPVYLNQSIREALEDCRHPLTALVAPEIRIDDDRWFGKMQQIFHRDPICGIVDTEPNTASSTLPPVRRQKHLPAKIGCRFALLQTKFARSVLPFGGIDPVNFWSKEAMSGGGTSWAMPGVRYFEVEHEEHEVWRAPLGEQAQSE
ncbi:MAG: hypothetical protein GY906_23570 [bacterium]|nr:hypothetical protein [bacterium]